MFNIYAIAELIKDVLRSKNGGKGLKRSIIHN